MAGVRKIVERMLREPMPADWDANDVIRVPHYFGYRELSPKGSHRRFVSADGERRLTIPVVSGRKVKPGYIRHLVKLLGLQEWMEEKGNERQANEEED